jgi:hypothetical protein
MDQDLTKAYIDRLKQNLHNITDQFIILEARYEIINKLLEEANAKNKSLEGQLVDTKTSKSK